MYRDVSDLGNASLRLFGDLLVCSEAMGKRLRILLPVVHFILFGALVAFGWREHVELTRRWAGWVDAPYSALVAWATAISLPAVIGAMPVVIVVNLALRSVGVNSEPYSIAIMSCAVVLFWYWIGKRLDRASHARRRVIVLGCGALLVCSSALFLTFPHTHLIEMKLGILDWFIIGAWALDAWLRSHHQRTKCSPLGVTGP